MASAATADALCRLRRTVAELDAAAMPDGAAPALHLDGGAIDAALGGGLAFGALHELAPAQPRDAGAAAGFALALAALVRGEHPLLWVQTDFARMETGALYGSGLDLFGFSSSRLILVTVPRAVDVLWAMEEALRSRVMAIGEVPHDLDDLTVTRRLSLSARDSGGLGLILRQHLFNASAATTRWEITAVPSLRDCFGGLGRTAFVASLTKNRRGRCGRWLLTWDHHACVFLPALSVGVAETAGDRPDRAPLIRAG